MAAKKSNFIVEGLRRVRVVEQESLYRKQHRVRGTVLSNPLAHREVQQHEGPLMRLFLLFLPYVATPACLSISRFNIL